MERLTLVGVTKLFGSLRACDDISFEVQPGEILGVMGPNGAGKTTLFECISGFQAPDSGTITFGSRAIHRLSPDAINLAGIARTFQKLRPFVGMTLVENVTVGALSHIRSVRHARERALELLEYVGLTEKRDTFAEHLSTGQRKRLEVARALATEPKLVLLDEVTGGVDVTAVPGLVSLVERLQQDGKSVLMIEHNPRILTMLSNRIVAMDLGRVIAIGSAKEVTSNPDVVSAYLGRAHA